MVPTSAPTAPAAPAGRLAHRAQAIGVRQCADALRRTLRTTPIGWTLVAWLANGRAPTSHALCWVALFAAGWLFNLAWLRRCRGERVRPRSVARGLVVIGLLDGAAWGAVSAFLVGYDKGLDAWIGAVLCGVTAVNAPVYITHFRAYAALVGAMATCALAGALAMRGVHALEFCAGLGVFFALMLVYMRPIGRRVVEGIELQLRNASLAERLRDALRGVEREACTDALTGQSNRRELDRRLRSLADERATAGAAPCSVLLLDIDHFKQVNDVHGHAVGDDTLRAFAERVRARLRPADMLARYGGEEFVALLPGTGPEEAEQVAERLRAAVASSPLVERPIVRATVSIGVATRGLGEPVDALLARADAAVYAAKRAGRDRVCVAVPGCLASGQAPPLEAARAIA